MRYIVTGGAGFIGSHFARLLLRGELGEDVEQVTVIDKLTYAGQLVNLKEVESDQRFRFIFGDIADRSLVSKEIDGHDVIVNFAAETHVDRSIHSADDFVNTNVRGTQVLLDCALEARIPLFIQISTDEVYGSISSGSWTEESPLLPNSPYAACKASADLLVRAYHRTFGLDARITRCSNNFGPNQFPEKVIPLFITNLLMGKKVPLYGNGLNSRDWLHVHDHCRGISRVVEGGRPGEIYNLGGGTELSNLQLTRMILGAFNLDDRMIEFVPDRLGHDFRYSVDWSKAKSQLGFRPHTTLESELPNLIDWYDKNRDWWISLRDRP